MNCKITAHAETAYQRGHVPLNHSEEAYAVALCETHHWRFPDGELVGTDTLCPIGRIEQATEAALAKIREASGAP